jgi:DNA-binding NtrC family response regulator
MTSASRMSPSLSPAIAIVVIDDNAHSLEFAASALRQNGVEIITANDAEAGLELILTRHPQIVLTDLVMPKMTGMELLEQVVEFDPSIDVVLMTAHYSTESAVEAIRKGASDYLNKPVTVAVLRQKIGALIEGARQRLRRIQLEDELLGTAQFQGMIGSSPSMMEMFARIRRVAPHFRSVLVHGETGTGKDLVARALHQLSPVSSGHLVVLNCSAVVETLFESELFGHMKGAFTGATSDKAGLFEHASGGVLFLDEIGDMPMATQAKLLRAVQNQEVQRLGSLTARKVDVRIVAATHRDLRALIGGKQFREDLYYRLSMVEIRVPALRERKEDLQFLVRHFVERFAGDYGKKIRGLTQRAQIRLANHSWPGNVRELENVIGHACMMVMTETIDLQDLPEYLNGQLPISESTAGASINFPSVAGAVSLEEQEKLLLISALEQARGNQSQAARRLRIGRDALRYKMKKHNLE